MKIHLLLAAAMLTACSSVPPDPNISRADRNVKARVFPDCEPRPDTPPKLIAGRTPKYPVNRLLAEKDGYAVIAFDITAAGRARNLTEIESSHPKFYNHTHNAVAKWKFEPARQDGVAVAVRCSFRQDFIVTRKSHRGRM
jgi:TonB family protein